MENKQENAFQRRFNFDNVGTKIKNFTKWYCWVSIIVIWVASAICLFVGFADDTTLFLSLIAAVAAIIMPFIIWISSWVMYAFGELVEKTVAIECNAHGDVPVFEKHEDVNPENQNTNRNERRENLERLRAQGLITEEEFQHALNKGSDQL